VTFGAGERLPFAMCLHGVLTGRCREWPYLLDGLLRLLVSHLPCHPSASAQQRCWSLTAAEQVLCALQEGDPDDACEGP
jgi:hypothetical protein